MKGNSKHREYWRNGEQMWKELFHLTNEQAVVFLKDKIDEHIKKMKVIKAKKIATRMLREIGIESNYFVEHPRATAG